MNFFKSILESRLLSDSKLPPLIISGLMTVAASAMVVHNELVWDDVFLIRDFQQTMISKSPWEILTVPFWENSSYNTAPLPGYWRPLTSFVLWLLANIGGSTWIYHTVSLIALLATGIAIALLLVTICPSQKIAAIWVCMIFCIHPLSVEVLCMASNISDHLSLLFMVLSLTLSIQYLLCPKRGLPAAIAMATFFSCASKELGILCIGILPLAILTVRLCRPHSFAGRIPKRSIAILFPVTILPVLTFLILRNITLTNAGELTPLVNKAFQIDPILLLFAWGQLLKHTFLPVPAGAHLMLHDTDIAAWVWGILYVLLPLLLLTVKHGNKNIRYFSMLSWYLSALVIIPSLPGADSHWGSIFIPIRYFNIPLTTMLIAVLPFFSRAATTKLHFALPIAVVSLALLSFIRISDWNNSLSLYTAEYFYHPHSAVDAANLCEALIRRKKFNEAEKTIIEFEQNNRPLYGRRAAMKYAILSKIVLRRDGDINLATHYIQKALWYNQYELQYVFNLAQIRLHAGHPEEAIWVLRQALTARWHTKKQKNVIRNRIKNYSSYLKSENGDDEIHFQEQAQ
ncbi:MAG: hypothetical protein JXR76_29280 [Deltaproteobacteria bacterium]|nr:hypothetical protein [Deltaproteobacteria bacterium]